MKTAVLAAGLLCCALTPVHAQSRVAGVWQTEIQPNVFWTIELRVDGAKLTGTVAEVAIVDGAVDGDAVSFKVELPDGDRIVTFRGTVGGDEMAFTRDVQFRQGGPQGGVGIFGAAGPRTFTLQRVPAGQAPKTPRGAAWLNQLTVYDRHGRVLLTLGEPDSYTQPALSPDGSRLAVSVRRDILVFDIARGTRTRVTSTPRSEASPAWSPDGRYIAYVAIDQERRGLYRKPSDGAGEEELLFQNAPGVAMNLTDWSPDGRLLTFGSGGVMFIVPADGERKPIELAREEYSMTGGRFSPDSRFLAYWSDETGAGEVFVRQLDARSGFPAGGGKWQVSKGGLGMIYWRGDGRELLYLDAKGEIMAVEVSTTPTFKAGAPRRVFPVPDTFPLVGTPGARGSISRNAERVALAVPIPPPRQKAVLPRETLAKYAGSYTASERDAAITGMEVTIVLEQDQLVLIQASGERSPLIARSETSFFLQRVSTEVDFVMDEWGTVSHLLIYSGGPPIRMARK